MGSPGKLDHPARRLNRKAGIDFGDDLLGRISIVRIVDHGLSWNARVAHDEGTGHDIGLAFNVRALVPIDPHGRESSSRPSDGNGKATDYLSHCPGKQRNAPRKPAICAVENQAISRLARRSTLLPRLRLRVRMPSPAPVSIAPDFLRLARCESMPSAWYPNITACTARRART